MNSTTLQLSTKITNYYANLIGLIMKQLDEQLKFKILQLCSGHYLSANIPDDWYDLTEEEQNQFLRDSNWQPFDHYDPDYVENCIEYAATATQHFIEDLLDNT